MRTQYTPRYGDQDIWDALEKVQLAEYIHSLEGELDYKVTEGGSNFSVGQRQLICFVRCMLRKPKILLLDEATASIDTQTDAKLQYMIRSHFEGSTVITIAHRLDTIMDSHRVMVLEQGELAEFDTPERLLSNPDGLFSQFVEAHGDEYATHLRTLATPAPSDLQPNTQSTSIFWSRAGMAGTPMVTGGQTQPSSARMLNTAGLSSPQPAGAVDAPHPTPVDGASVFSSSNPLPRRHTKLSQERHQIEEGEEEDNDEQGEENVPTVRFHE